MKRGKAGRRIGCAAAIVLLSAAMMAGCAGPSTMVRPRQTDSESLANPEAGFTLEAANPFYIQETLLNLTAAPRPSGSRQENDTARNMEKLLLEYGYKVTRQRFRYEQPDGIVSGSNVVAVRSSPNSDSDILIICTHHDTAESSFGANDNASGVAVLLETARLLSRVPTDTEIRLVSFSGHEQDLLGSRYYTQALTRRERERILGVIDLDQLGYAWTPDVILGTMDGNGTMLGDMLRESSQTVLEEDWDYRKVFGGDASSFLRSRIPAVTLTQAERAYEQGTPYDNMEVVNAERLARLTEVVCQTAVRIMDPNTPSMSAKSHAQNDLRQNIYTQEAGDLILFGESLEKTQAQIGVEGRLVAETIDSEGNSTQKYQFFMKWFGIAEPIPTDYSFVNGKLDSVALRANDVGISFDEMRSQMSGWYGDSSGGNAGPTGTEYTWVDSLSRRQITLRKASDGFEIQIAACDPGRTIVEIRRPDGTMISERSGDLRVARLLPLIQALLPEYENNRVENITFYTDGIGGSAGELLLSAGGQAARGAEPEEQAGETDHPESEPEPKQETRVWELWIDLDDAMDERGEFRDRVSTVELLVGLSADMLEDDYREAFDTAVNRGIAGKPEPTDSGQADFREEQSAEPGETGSDRQGQADNEGAGSEGHAASEETAPEETAPAGWSIPEWQTPSEEEAVAETDAPEEWLLPDFAESFRLFVLTGDGESGVPEWDRRVGFFSGYPEWKDYRNQVRERLGLQTSVTEQNAAETEEEGG